MNAPRINNWENRPELSPLINYCDEIIRPRLAALETQRLAMRRKRNIRATIYLVLFTLTILVCAKITGWNLSLFLVSGFGYFLVTVFSSSDKIETLAKSEIISDIFSNLGWEYTPEFEKSADFYLLDRYGVFPKWHKKQYKDKIKGKIDNVPFEAFEAHLTHGSGEGETQESLFLIKAPSVLNFLGTTHIRNKRHNSDIKEKSLPNLKRAKFVSSKFENRFDVYSTDSVEAQYLLSPDKVEAMLAFKRLRTALKSITYFEGHLFVLLGADFFEIKRTKLPLSDPIHVDVILEEIDLLHQVFDFLNKWT